MIRWLHCILRFTISEIRLIYTNNDDNEQQLNKRNVLKKKSTKGRDSYIEEQSIHKQEQHIHGKY